MKRILLLLALAGCYLHRYPVTPEVAEGSTYRIFNDEHMGTAWAVDRHHVVTAGHMCESVVSDHYMLVSDRDRRIPARMLESEYGAKGLGDLCILETQVEVAEGLILADVGPKIGEPVTSVGYPNGEYAVSKGKYLGDLDGPSLHGDDDVSDGPADHGASGSAVFTPRGVVGVLVRGRTDGKQGYVFIALPALRALLHDAGVGYDTTPNVPPDPEDLFPHPGLG